MAWSTPPTWTPGQLVGATDMAILSNDLAYLLNRPATSVKRDNGANYTTSSTIFADIDGTNLAITFTISGSAILMGFVGVLAGLGTVVNQPYFDFTIDGTRYASAGTDGLVFTGIGTVNGSVNSVAPTALATGLSPGSHTIKIQWKVGSAGTGTLYAGSGIGATDFIPTLWAAEVG